MYKGLIHILLVDDDAGDCRLAKLTLAKAKQPVEFAVQTAGNLAECLKRLKSHSFDLVLLDLGLPDSQGLATVDRVCEVCPDIPIVVLTNLADEEAGVEAVERGAGDYLVKNKVFKDLLVRTIRYSLERKKAEEKLRRAAEEWQRTFNSISDLLFIGDKDFTIVKANKALANAVGLDVDAVVGEKCYELLHRSDKPWLDCPLEKTKKDKKNHTEEINDPNIGVPLLVTTSPILNNKGELTGAVHIARDLTERRVAEEELSESAGKLNAMLQAIGDHISMMDKDLNIIWANETAQKIFGNDIIGKKCYEVYHKRKQPCEPYPCLTLKAFQDGKVHEHDTQVVDKDGRVIYFHCTANVALRDRDGRPTGVIEISRDITEHKEAEQRQTQLLTEVEQANRELRDFMHMVSHDLKNSLSGIGRLAEWISTDCADKLGEASKEQMGLLLARVNRTYDFIDGMVRYCGIGRVKEERAEVNLNELVPKVIDMIVPPENITITIENRLPVVECEEAQIIQIFQNLLGNAVKYMDKPQGQIRIGCTRKDDFWKFSVSDNGPGIEEKYFGKIFQIFQTLLPRDEVESAGIGLGVVKKIVEMYGGRIWVESKPGQGSTFFFTLPKQEMGAKKCET